MSPIDLIAFATKRGVQLEAAGSVLRCRSAGPLPADLTAMLKARKADLLAHLAGPSARGGQLRGQREACRLMEAADALVEQLGVDGRHPAIADAAAMVANAYATGDMESLRFALAEFDVAVRRAAVKRISADRDQGTD